jgi:HNH endonuclease/NUMOD4 motif
MLRTLLRRQPRDWQVPKQQPEEWRPIPGFDGYEASDRGRIRSKKSYGWKIMKGYRMRRLKSVGFPGKVVKGKVSGVLINLRGRVRLVHRLILLTFRGPCPPGMQACHWDDVATNNRLSNLRWDTQVANMADARRNGGQPAKGMRRQKQLIGVRPTKGRPDCYSAAK